MLLASFVTVTFLGLSSRFQCVHLSVYECVLHIADGKVSPVYLCSCSLGHHYWTPIIIVYNSLYPIEAQTWGAHIVSIARWFFIVVPHVTRTWPKPIQPATLRPGHRVIQAPFARDLLWASGDKAPEPTGSGWHQNKNVNFIKNNWH